MKTAFTMGVLAGATLLALATVPAVAGPSAVSFKALSAASETTTPVILTGARVGRKGRGGLGLGLGLGLGTAIGLGSGHNNGLNVGVGANVGAGVDLGHRNDINIGVGTNIGVKLGGSNKRRRRH